MWRRHVKDIPIPGRPRQDIPILAQVTVEDFNAAGLRGPGNEKIAFPLYCVDFPIGSNVTVIEFPNMGKIVTL
ncbi:hypothetical protein SLA2020_335040 [Shorea laevis]